MDNQQDYGNAFVIPNFGIELKSGLETTDFTEPAIADHEPQEWRLDLDLDGWNFEAEIVPSLKLPAIRLSDVFDGSGQQLEELGSLASRTPSLSDTCTESSESIEADIWSAPEFLKFEEEPQKPRRWETSIKKEAKVHSASCISEGGPGVFDALLSLHTSQNPVVPGSRAVRVLKLDPVIACLAHLGLGQESALFSYNALDQKFHARIGAEHVRPSGFSPKAFSSLEADFFEYGNRVKYLQTFVTNTCASSRPLKALVSFAGCVRTILYRQELALHEASTTIKTILQLQALFRNSGEVLTFLDELVCHSRSARNEEQVLSLLYECAEKIEHCTWSQPIVFEILTTVSRPWLDAAGNWLGVIPRTTFHSGDPTVAFAHKTEAVEDAEGKEASIQAYVMDDAGIPGFLSVEDGVKMFKTGQSLRLLQAHRPSHPLARVAGSGTIEPPSLAFKFSWPDIHEIQQRANQYETDLQAAVRAYDEQGSPEMSGVNLEAAPYDDEVSNVRSETSETYLSTSIAEIEQQLPDLLLYGTKNYSQAALASHSTQQEHGEFSLSRPPLCLVPSLSLRPVISVQARLVNQACLSMLFKGHKLRSHLSLQYRYSLLSDGVFSSRLSHALFDSELPSTERRQGKPRLGVSGLRLGSREIWPPASSELRLALMGILSDTYHRVYIADVTISGRSELPGNMSFAIRAMSEEELGRCMDPNSIFALDFLRLQYKPPAPIDAVIKQSSLDKYDTIFKLLLRAARLLYSVKQLSRVTLSRNLSCRSDTTAQRFSIEAIHFVSSIYGYFFEQVCKHWNLFEGQLDSLEKRTEQYALSEHEGPDKLRDIHEKMLDGMMFGLLLRKRQEAVMGLLEEIFGLILDFANRVRAYDSPKTDLNDDSDEREELYKKWRKKIKVFVAVCRGLSERNGSAGASGFSGNAGGENSIEKLLVTLEMNDYYSRRTA